MKTKKSTNSRLAGLLVLALGTVALLALSGVATAKDRGGKDDGHGRHHNHLRDLHDAGTISAFDASSGKLTIALTGGGSLTGLVTKGTEIRCEGVDDRLTQRRDHGSDDGGGHGAEPGDDNGGGAEPGDDQGGHGTEPGDDNGGNAPVPTPGAPAPGTRACGTSSLVSGAFVEEAKLRIGTGSAVFREIELGHDS